MKELSQYVAIGLRRNAKLMRFFAKFNYLIETKCKIYETYGKQAGAGSIRAPADARPVMLWKRRKMIGELIILFSEKPGCEEVAKQIISSTSRDIFDFAFERYRF